MAYYPPYHNRGNYINPMIVPQADFQYPQNTSEMIWVLNESEATSYPVAPNNSVVLWDKNQNVIYVKSANMQGVPSMRILEFTERTQNEPQKAVQEGLSLGDKFVTLDTFKALEGKMEQLQARFDELNQKAVTQDVKTNKNSKKDDE